MYRATNSLRRSQKVRTDDPKFLSGEQPAAEDDHPGVDTLVVTQEVPQHSQVDERDSDERVGVGS
jgi:hypothetical protein